jgi:lysophosphatidate acyltransferase
MNYASEPKLLPLKRGAAALAVEAGNIPIVPVAIETMTHVFSMKKRTFRAGALKVRVLPALSTKFEQEEGKENAIDRLTEQLRQVIMDALTEMSGPYELGK